LTYNLQKAKFAKEPVYLIEIDLTACSLVYGNSPCTASGTAANSCFNSFKTCQDLPNFATTTKTYRFSSTRLDGSQGDTDAPTFPVVLDVNTAPTQLTPAKGLGIRSTCTIKMTDFPWTDIGVDPYVASRTYDPREQGTFFGKLLARHPYYSGRVCRVKTGYLADDGTYDASNFITRTYFIESIHGPDKNGNVSMVTKDILSFASNAKAQLPVQSQAEITGDITSSATSIAINDPNDDIKDAYDANQKYIRIDDETMLMTNLTGSNPTYTLTVTRAAMPGIYTGVMTAEEHSAESTVQQCYHFDTIEIDNIVEYLLESVAGISAGYLDKAGWQRVIDFGLQSYTFSALITEPTGIDDLLTEITEHTILLWWDERAQLVKMDSILNRPPDYGPFDDDSNLISQSVNVGRSDKERISQVWVAYGLRNPVLEMDELKNYAAVKLSADLDAEGVNQHDEKRVRRVWSRWIPLGLGTVASEITNRLLNYYKVTKKVITISMDAKNDDAWTGDIIKVKTRQVQDEFGGSPYRDYRVLQTNEILTGSTVQYKYIIQSTDRDSSRIGVITPDLDPNDGVSAFPDYDGATITEELKTRYAFISPDSGIFPSDNLKAYEIQ
jgi:hypothetical protein